MVFKISDLQQGVKSLSLFWDRVLLLLVQSGTGKVFLIAVLGQDIKILQGVRRE